MTSLKPDRFTEFFTAVHGHSPYPWQEQLAARAIVGDWPGAIDLPTGSGKTATLDVAVYALAAQAALPAAERTAPRRIFFCVNRRVIVDEAFARARRIASSILRAEHGDGPRSILGDVADALRRVGGVRGHDRVPPLDVHELRGGIHRDNRWARSLIQPSIVCTTLDQLGSRLLFRGYGVSSNAAPIEAALVAYDALVLLDEAHISEPFRQTLESVQRYLRPEQWATTNLAVRPLTVVPMTATPTPAMTDRGVLRLTEADRRVPSLQARLNARKPASLRTTKDVVKEATAIVRSLEFEEPIAVGIIVNRVATAKAIHDTLCKDAENPGRKKSVLPEGTAVELVIGSMRPIDRDRQAERLRGLVGPERPAVSNETSVVVATQCLEVGADYDFDVLLTECASLDALRQRFGRLNRRGRSIDARAFILAAAKDIKEEDKLDDEKPLDPIYGNALARTWHWLTAHATADTIDVGIAGFATLLDAPDDEGRPPSNLLAPSALLDAPVMLPAHVDFWCQTAPPPALEPAVSSFIHGPRRGEPDVQVCWRSDLGGTPDHSPRDQWCDVVALLPPSSAECMSVPLSRVRRWLADHADTAADRGDALGAGEEEGPTDEDREPSTTRSGVLWRGVGESRAITSPADLRPGDTVVLPAWDAAIPADDGAIDALGAVLGHLPAATDDPIRASTNPPLLAIPDLAEAAFARARDRAALRLHPSVRRCCPAGAELDALFAAATDLDEPPTAQEWRDLLEAAAAAVEEEHTEFSRRLRSLAAGGLRIEPYPDARGVVLTARTRLHASSDWMIRAMDDGDDDASHVQRDIPVTLEAHTQHVRDAVRRSISSSPLEPFGDAFESAALLHDLGKADERFQALLRRTDRTDAWLMIDAVAPLAKSDGVPQTPVQRRDARDRAGLPEGFRHEMLSAELAPRSERLPDDPTDRELVLHLIAAHHGHGRPFAPVVHDEAPPGVEIDEIALTAEERRALPPPHRLDSGIAGRFWTLTRQFGWWGLAYLEAVLRLADQHASAAEDAGAYDVDVAVAVPPTEMA